MTQLSSLEKEVAGLIVESLHLEDIGAADIDPAAPLFGDGLGLDSIDALELSLALQQRYGVKIKSQDEENVHIFGSLRALCQHVHANRANA